MPEDIEIFARQCVFMRSIYKHYQILFEQSSADDKSRMSRVAETFFGDVNRVFLEYIILQACKLTDPARDPRGNDNLTIAFLLTKYDFSAEHTTKARLDALNRQLQDFRAKLLPARNKLISHADRDANVAGSALGGASQHEWNQFWLDLQDVVCIIHEKAVGWRWYINGGSKLSDADQLLKALCRLLR